MVMSRIYCIQFEVHNLSCQIPVQIKCKRLCHWFIPSKATMFHCSDFHSFSYKAHVCSLLFFFTLFKQQELFFRDSQTCMFSACQQQQSCAVGCMLHFQEEGFMLYPLKIHLNCELWAPCARQEGLFLSGFLVGTLRECWPLILLHVHPLWLQYC